MKCPDCGYEGVMSYFNDEKQYYDEYSFHCCRDFRYLSGWRFVIPVCGSEPALTPAPGFHSAGDWSWSGGFRRTDLAPLAEIAGQHLRSAILIIINECWALK